jgi:hypothetical protein
LLDEGLRELVGLSEDVVSLSLEEVGLVEVVSVDEKDTLGKTISHEANIKVSNDIGIQIVFFIIIFFFHTILSFLNIRVKIYI